MSLSIHTFAIEDDGVPGHFDIQWQTKTFVLNCTAIDVSFTQKIIDLVAETRANPAYRDIPLGNGRFRHMDPKGVDLSECFADLMVSMFKCGQCDHGYDFRFESASSFWVAFHLADDELDDFLYGLNEIIEDNSEAPTSHLDGEFDNSV